MDRSKISTAWIADLDKDQKEEFITLLLNNHSNLCLIRLKEIVSQRRESLEKSERNVEMYDSANWAHKQAHNNGARQMLKFVEDLLAFTS